MKDEKLTAAQKGIIMHLCLQKIDLRREYTEIEIIEFINKLVSENFITEEEKNSIDINKIKKFIDSDFAKRIRKAKIIEKEKPFYTYIKANELYSNSTDENILVQGIIDLYFIEENENIVLVDYKTDHIKNENELVEKYKVQLKIYKDALRNSLDRKIEDVFIYSVYLEKEIKIDV